MNNTLKLSQEQIEAINNTPAFMEVSMEVVYTLYIEPDTDEAFLREGGSDDAAVIETTMDKVSIKDGQVLFEFKDPDSNGDINSIWTLTPLVEGRL